MKRGKQKKNSLGKELKKYWFFFLLPIPGLLFLILFCYMPMAGLYIVFERYTFQGGLLGSEFVGLDNFEFFFKNMGNALRATRNTLVINGFSIVLGTIANVALAIALDEIGSHLYKKVTRSVMLFHYFISWIVVGMVAMTMLDEDRGICNRLVTALGGQPVAWYSNPAYWWPILILFNIWKGAGYNSIVYYCALTGFGSCQYG